MKKYIFLAASALTLASCTSDDFLGDTPGSNSSAATAKEISFSGEAGKTTRAGETTGENAATALGNNFVVFGTKTVGGEAKNVYDNYSVSYSNSKWDYVGTFGEKNQTIKYWDYSASKYDFIAYSLGKGTTKATPSSITSTGYTLTGSADALAGCYIADKVTVEKKDFQKAVTIKFYSLAAKVTIGIFEIIPGYSVKDVKFYANDGDNAPSTTPTLYSTGSTIPTSNENNKMNVTYAANVAKPTITFDTNVSKTSSITFGALSMTDNKLGTTNPTASKPEASNTVLPANVGALTLKVDYTLVSEDGSGEEINVKGTTAVVPSTFTNWEANHAYTYIFKITDKTNGTTGGTGDTTGLFPITFDAVVTKTEIGNQETITVMNQPSITTYAKDANGNEYKSGSNIYVSTSDTENLTLPTENNQASNCALYTITTTGSYPATEALVEQCLSQGTQGTDGSKTLKIGNNTIKVTKADGLSIVSSIDANDTSDGKAINGNFAKFTAKASTIYAFEYTKTSTNGNEGALTTTKYYKVINVGN